MKYPFKHAIPFMVTFLFFSMGVSAQEEELNDSLKTKLTRAAREIMDAAGTCALITLDEKDVPMVRAMDPFPPEADFTIWFGTNPKSSKIGQIKNDPTVTVYYLDSDASGYVVVHGKARLIDDQKAKERYWKPEWEAFYVNKTDDYLLIEVIPEWLEVLSPARGINGDPVTWRTPRITFGRGK